METTMTDHSTKEDKKRLQLPKNIRQIGNIQGPVRIYVEDYVYTYLHGSGRPGWAHRGSIFLGNRCQENGQKFIFISGLVHIPDECFQDGIPEFTDLMWGGIYQEMKQFYEDVEILGWGMDLAGTSAKLTGDLERIHRNAFQSQDKLLFLMDSLENEEAFYVYEKNMLRRRDGYYVYYEKNPQMQEYMMQGKDEKEARPEVDPQRGVVTSYRAITAEKSRKSGKGFHAFVYVASLALLASVSAMGINMMSSAGKIHRLEEVVSYLQTDKTSVESETTAQGAETGPQMMEDVEGTSGAAVQTEKQEIGTKLQTESDLSGSDIEREETEKNAAEVTQKDEEKEPQADGKTVEAETEETQKPSVKPQETEEKEDKEEKKKEESKAQTAAAFADQDYYIVQKGESLLGISQKIYGKDYTKELCERNELEDENKIYAGQKLLLLDK